MGSIIQQTGMPSSDKLGFLFNIVPVMCDVRPHNRCRFSARRTWLLAGMDAGLLAGVPGTVRGPQVAPLLTTWLIVLGVLMVGWWCERRRL